MLPGASIGCRCPSTSSIITHRLRRWPPFLPKNHNPERRPTHLLSTSYSCGRVVLDDLKPLCSHNKAAIVLLADARRSLNKAARADGFCGSCLGLILFLVAEVHPFPLVQPLPELRTNVAVAHHVLILLRLVAVRPQSRGGTAF